MSRESGPPAGPSVLSREDSLSGCKAVLPQPNPGKPASIARLAMARCTGSGRELPGLHLPDLRVNPRFVGYHGPMDPHDELLQTPAPESPAPRWMLPAWLPVRTLGARHRERVLTHLLALEPLDRHRRFGQVATDDQIGSYVAQIDFERDEVFGIFDARLRLVAMAHLAFTDAAESTACAEFGVSVLPRGRGRGLGSRLFELAVLHARNRGARTLIIHLARDNAPMLAIVRRSGASVRYEGADAVAHLTLPDDSIGSHLGALAESQAANLDYRLKRQALRWRALWTRAPGTTPGKPL